MGVENDRELATPAVRADKKGKTHSCPSKYQVYLLNDDYTPMDFVVEVLQAFFSKSYPAAVEIMLAVHVNGKATCGVYSRDVAETKVAQVNEFAREHEHPLLCKMEKM